MTRLQLISTRCWTCCPASSPPNWRSRPPPNCATRATTLPAITRRYGEPTTTTSAPHSGWRGSVRERETGPARSRRLTRCPPRQRISRRQRTTAVEILLDGCTPENTDEQTLLDAGNRAAALTLESAAKRASIRLRVFGSALGWLQAGNEPKAPATARRRLRGTRYPGRDGTLLPRAGARDDRHVGAHRVGGESKCGSAEDTSMTTEQAMCPQCAAVVGRADRFCESCGAGLSEVRRVAIPRPGRFVEAPCPDCGNETHADDYCTVCGHRRAEPDRDEADIDVVVLVTDRGIEHARNEDAAAAGIVVGSGTEQSDAIAVAVCDGVSTSGDAQVASVAASKAGVDAMLAALAASRTSHAAVLAGLADAAKAAACAKTGADGIIAPSCTYTAATVVPTSAGTVQITIGNVGDSRAYWLPRPPAPAQQLTVDDSLAQELITAGAAADSEAVQRGAHTLTRWLGADSEAKPWSDDRASARSQPTARGGCCCAATDYGTTCPTPPTSQGSAPDSTRPRQRAHWSITPWTPAARTTSLSQ